MDKYQEIVRIQQDGIAYKKDEVLNIVEEAKKAVGLDNITVSVEIIPSKKDEKKPEEPKKEVKKAEEAPAKKCEEAPAKKAEEAPAKKVEETPVKTPAKTAPVENKPE